MKVCGVCLSLYLLVSFSISCNKYLDNKPNDKLFIPSTVADLQSLLDDDGTMNTTKSPSYGEACCDDFFLNDNEFNGLGEMDQAPYIWQPYYTEGQETDWSNGYEPVYVSNLVLGKINDISRVADNASEWDNIKGSALFYRSYYFLGLLWDYSKSYDSSTAAKDWGIALRTSSDFNVLSVRATNEQSYNMVINDTKAAIPLLPDSPTIPTRPSKAAAYGLLARCYLSMRDYKDALLYADSSLQINSQLMDYNNDVDIPNGINSGSPFKLFNKETIFLSTLTRDYGDYLTQYNGSIDTVLISLYDSSDLRTTAFYDDNSDGYKYFKGTYSGDNFNFAGIATDEMFLIRAEGYIRTGNLQKGISDINALLSKRYITDKFKPLNPLNQADALLVVLNERRKELVMRGMRWTDIKRLNKEGSDILLKRIVAGKIYTLEPNANFYALPIPDYIIKITGMPQNTL